jgi:predicted ATP-grasp superfamily ATP-dependent carboligase
MPMKTITAFVTGADHPTALGAARALHAAGATVIGFTHRHEAWACRSRAWAEIRRLSGGAVDEAASEVLSAAEGSNCPIFLLPTEDDMVAEFSRTRDQFPELVRMCCPPDHVVRTLLEKTRFVDWAESRGYPVPRSKVAHSKEELTALLKSFSYPAILKPLVRTPEWQRSSPVEKAIRLEASGDIEGLPFDLFRVAPSYVVSEWIEGDDSDVYFCLAFLDSRSEIVASFSGRKLLQYPRLTGSTAICASNDLPELDVMTADLFRAVGCQGLASLEVKRSATDGKLLITEPTVGRPNLQSFAAVAAGVNLCGIAMRHVWGQDFSDLLGPRKQCVWIEESGLFEVLTTRTRVPVPVRMILREAVRARRISGAYLAISDPGPFVAMAGNWARNGFRRIFPVE